MIALITPTGRRKEQIENCERWMRNQTYIGDILWCVVDDCYPSTIMSLGEGFGANWNIIKLFPEPKWRSGQITQGRNIRCALDTIEQYPEVKAIFIIEDDDYYKPVYLEAMIDRMGEYDVVGEKFTIYYNVLSRTHFRNRNDSHASLFQMAFTPRVAELFREQLNERFIDMAFFDKLYKNGMHDRINLFQGEDFAIGIKGMRGRQGIGAGHGRHIRGINDSELKYLTKKIGDDASYYERCYIHYGSSRDKRPDKTGIRKHPGISSGRKDDNRRWFEPWK